MKYFRYAVIAFTVALTGCASTGSGYKGKSGAAAGQQKDIWERVRKGFDMQDLKDPRVEYWTNYYAARPKSVQTMAERSRPYIYHITKELEARNMPTELALLPFVESAYNAQAYSRSKAAGLWQFIPSTGTHYKLAQDWWKDERRDPIFSTRAALDYLSYLHRFQDNDWHLALASYNWGEGAVKRARNRNAASGLGTDYLSLRMPQETRDYVPKLQAIENIIANPGKYGIVLPNIPDQPYFEEVAKNEDIDVSLIVKLAGISMEEFKILNPAPNRQVLLAQHRPRVLLPKNKVAQYKKNLNNYKGEKSQWQGYTPNAGESMASIAQRYGISLDQLKSLNGYGRSQNVALSSRTLIVPRLGVSRDASPSGIDTRDIQNPVASSSTMLASNQVNMPVQAPPISQVNPNVRLGQASAQAAQPRLAANAVANTAASTASVNRTLASNTVSNDDILQRMITSNNLDRAPQAPAVANNASLRASMGDAARAAMSAPVRTSANPSLSSPSAVASPAAMVASLSAPASPSASVATTSAMPAPSNNYEVSAQAANSNMIASLVANPQAVPSSAVPSSPAPTASPRLASAASAPAVARQADYNPAASTVSARPATVASAITRAAANNQAVVHTVKAGETLYSLARRYNTTVDSVKALNNIGTQAIKVGDRLRMPGSGAQS